MHSAWFVTHTTSIKNKMETNKKMGDRKDDLINEVIKKQNKENEQPPRRIKFTHSNTRFYCPVCGNTFTNKQMWETIAKDTNGPVEASKILQCHYTTIRQAVIRFNLEFAGDKDREATGDWQEISERYGYSDPKEMFYNLKIERGFSFKRMATLLEQPVDRVKMACKVFLSGGNESDIPIETENEEERR